MKVKKKILSLFTAITLLMSCMPMFTPAASAAETPDMEYSLDGGDWKELDSLENLYLKDGFLTAQSVNVRLNNDVDANFSYPPTIVYNNNTVTIDGQGYTLRRGTSECALFSLNYPGSLKLENIVIDGGAVWSDAENVSGRTNSGTSLGGNSHLIAICDDSATVTLNRGTVLQNNCFSGSNSTFNGAAVMVEKGLLVMDDAVIRNNSAIDNGSAGGGAGAVQINSGASFTMNGGEIYGNYASLVGGAIKNEGAFKFNVGKISNNVSATNGGGIVNNGTVAMTGGMICENSSRLGGGVLESGSGFTMSGGSILDNTAFDDGEKKGNGGGIYCNNSLLSVSGAARITGNKYGENANNVYLPTDKTITVSAALTDHANIGVTTAAAPTLETPVNVTGANDADYSQYFTSDNTDYIIQNSADNIIQLAKIPHEHKICCSADCVDGHEDINWTEWTDTASMPTDAGNYYLTADVTLVSAWNVPSGTTNLCLNGHTLTGNDVSEGGQVIKISSNTTLNLCDCSNGKTGMITGGAANGVSFSELVSTGNTAPVFNMYGGTISGINYTDPNASPGAAVNLNTNNAEFHIYGGSIKNNGAIGVDVSSGKFFVSGAVDISNNSSSYATMMRDMSELLKTYYNVDLGTIGEYIDIGVQKGNYIQIESPVTMANKSSIFMPSNDMSFCGTFTSGWSEKMNDKSPADYFASAASAFAVLTDTDGEAELATPPHTHDMSAECGNENALTYTALDASFTGGALAAGNYYLAADVTLDRAITIAADTEVNLCLNGHTITQNAPKAAAIAVSSGGTLNLCDCSSERSGKITKGSGLQSSVISNSGTFNMYGGSVSDNDASVLTSSFNGVGISNKGIFNMYGGKITNNKSGPSGEGGAVYNLKSSDTDAAVFNMYGGEISGNTAKQGSGVSNRAGKFNMYGGKISGNSASDGNGGGIYNYMAYINSVETYGSVNIYDGEISGNTAKQGGGIYADNYVKILGGRIEGNSASSRGGGVLIVANKTLTVGGKAYITNSTKDGAANNVYMNSVGAIAVDTDSPLTNGAVIGVTSVKVPTDGNPVNITGANGADYSKYFASDNTEYKVKNTSDNVVQLTAPHKSLTHHNAVAATCKSAGNSEYWTCSGCGAMFSDANGNTEIGAVPVTAKTAHTENSGEVTTEATCTKKGTKTFKCTVCGETLRTVEIDKSPHTPVTDEAVRATCTQTGLTEGSHCGVCNAVLVPQEEIPKKTHVENDGEITKKATCTETGTKIYKCMICDSVLRTEELAATGHSYGAWTITAEPTTETQGEAARVCENDNTHTEKFTLPVLTDTSFWTKGEYTAPTADAEGSQKYTSDYGTVTVTIPKLTPTATPTAAPTAAPTAVPTAAPTAAPTTVPTAAPTAAPTTVPTAAPTAAPTAVPTATATVTPTVTPSPTPIASPSPAPSTSPLRKAELDIKPNTPNVTVEGLDELAAEIEPTASEIIVKMTIESKAEDSTDAKQNAIKAVSASEKIEYLDMSLTITIDKVESNITETDKNLVIVIPFDMTGKKNVNVYRCYGGSAAALSKNASDDEYFTMGDGVITVYANKFSTYAIGYDTESAEPTVEPTATPKRRSSGGGSSIQATPTPSPTPTPEATPELTDKPTIPETKEHKSYIVGYEGKFNPDGNITRAETAAILARLTDGFDENESYTSTFADVDSALWYANYIGFEENKSIITGYPDGTFMPEESITRAEFASMITRFANIDAVSYTAPFADTNGHWAQARIAECCNAGYIKGYEDNTFRPDNYITRAEAVAIINRVLGRNDIKDFENPFTDVSQNHWAYKDIMEAAVTHNI